LSNPATEIRLEPLERRHDRGAFDCGEPSVTNYLRQVALQAQEAMRAATKVAVAPAAPTRILGYFTLVGIKIIDAELPADLVKRFKIRNLAAGAPAVLLAQLAVDRDTGNAGLGTFLLRHALHHALRGAVEIGGVALIVDAVNADIATWYVKRVPDFRALAADGLRLILPMTTLAAALSPTAGR
jgi:hypothetical protein